MDFMLVGCFRVNSLKYFARMFVFMIITQPEPLSMYSGCLLNTDTIAVWAIGFRTTHFPFVGGVDPREVADAAYLAASDAERHNC
jgi:hypothetical protein